MHFTKMHGSGNDYIYVDCFHNPVPNDPAGLSRVISDRHFGVGADGLILICPSDKADAAACACSTPTAARLRCAATASVVLPSTSMITAWSTNPHSPIETGRGLLLLNLEISGGRVSQVRVDMGEPILEGTASRLPCPAIPPSSFP